MRESMITGEHSQAAGIDRQALMQPILQREIGHGAVGGNSHAAWDNPQKLF